MARLPKVIPRTKHINQSYHFFHEVVERNEVSIVATPTENQLADMLTKLFMRNHLCITAKLCLDGELS